MTAWVPPLVALAAGLGLWRLLGRRGGPAAVAVPLLGLLWLGLWMMALPALGVRWTPAGLLAPGVAGVLLALGVRLAGERRRPVAEVERGERSGALVAALLSAPALLLVAMRPVCGWDYRYIWGLKARVFALAGGHDASWLAWPEHAFAHPGYPPAWPDLLAAGAVLGADPARTAAAWHVLLAAALAAACWHAAAGARPPVRALAALVGAWAPVLRMGVYSGFSEPLLAFAAAVGLGNLRREEEGGRSWLLGGAIALAAVTKNEGLALAVALVVAAAVSGARWRVFAFAGALLPGLGWRIWAQAVAASGDRFEPSLSHLAQRVPELLSASLALPLLPLAVLGVWAFVLAALVSRTAMPELVALGIFAVAVIGAYLAGSYELAWWMRSLDRVAAVPLPVAVALALRVQSLAARAPVAPGRGAERQSTVNVFDRLRG